MKCSAAGVALCLAGAVFAFPQYLEEFRKREDGELAKRQDPFPFQVPPAGAVRAACRGHNTLANHGYINRNGKNLTLDAVLNGFQQAFGFDPAGLRGGVQNAINLCSAQTGTTCTAYDLNMLNQPHQIEHDGSLTACDKQMAYGPASNFAFNITVFQETMDIWSGAGTHVNFQWANTARLKRFDQARAQDAAGWFQVNAGGSSTEHAFILSTMNDPVLDPDLSNPQARLDWIEYWLHNQRLPTDAGWVKPTRVIQSADITSIAKAVRAAGTANVPALLRMKRNEDVALEPRATIPLSAVPSLLGAGNPAFTSAYSAAASRASAKVTPLPDPPNLYFEVYSPAQLNSLGNAVEKHIQTYQSIFQTELQSLLPKITLAPVPHKG